MRPGHTTPEERHQAALEQARVTVAAMSEDQARRELAALTVEWSRLNDRYAALLADRAEDHRRMRAVVARNVEAAADTTARRMVADSLWRAQGHEVLRRVAVVDVDRPKRADVQHLRPALAAWRDHVRALLDRDQITQQAAYQAAELVRSTHHADVLTWQGMVDTDRAERAARHGDLLDEPAEPRVCSPFGCRTDDAGADSADVAAAGRVA